jgi:2'-5' RNA ligase
MRLFAAVDLPEDVRDKVEEIQRNLLTALQNAADIKWVEPGQVHWTLQFLGECSEDRVTEIARALDAAAAGVRPFPARIGGVGTFPETGAPRILWLGLAEGGEAMADLAGRVHRALEPFGFIPDERPFSAHLTLGRVKRLQAAAQARTILEAAKAEGFASFTVDSIHLYRSVLSPQGPTYSLLHAASLH